MKLSIKEQQNSTGFNSEIFAIRLTGLQVLPQEQQQDYNSFLNAVLEGQMNFIYSLHEIPHEYAIELRYLFDHREPHEIKVYYIVHVKQGETDIFSSRTEDFAKNLLNLLLVNNRLHTFTLVKQEEELDYLINPFPFNHLVQLNRREGFISLDSYRKPYCHHLGFEQSIQKEGNDPTSSQTGRIYYVFPFASHLENMERLCDALFLQEYPCVVSFCLKPHRLGVEEICALEERIKQCEKFSQLTLDGSGNLEQLQPYLKIQATSIFKLCAQEYLQLQDAAFLLKIHIASSHPIGQGLREVLGTTVTKHAGHPYLPLADTVENAFVGGFHCYSPVNQKEHDTVYNNLQNMDFAACTPTVAPPGLENWRFLFNVSEACSAFRLPIPTKGEFPGIETTMYHENPAPSEIPTSGLFIGEHVHLQRARKVFITPGDRKRHLYAVGKTGTGKSSLFLQMILQDMENGDGLGLIDPHGELVEQVLAAVPRHREDDVIYIDPQDIDHPIGINMLEYQALPEKDFCVNYLIEVFDLLYDLRQTGGPIFEMYMRNALQLLLDQPPPYRPTILEVPRVFQDKAFRKSLLDSCTNIFVNHFWELEAERAGGDVDLRNVAPYITSKLCRFVYNDLMRPVIGQKATTINFRNVMDQKKILLVDLRKGLLGETNSHFLGMLLVGKIFSAALSRTAVKEKENLANFYLYVDEFHNLATPTFIDILSEARKYSLALILTNQYIAQLKDHLVQGIFGNVGTLVSFRVGANDAELLSKEFSRLVSESDLLGLSNWQAYVRLLINGNVSAPFNLRTVLPYIRGRDEAVEKIRDQSRKNYGRPRAQVEAEIQKAWLSDYQGLNRGGVKRTI